jgi:methylenetetrahydrofolate reductase (NADPH)
MRIKDVYRDGFRYSFEVFPPKTPQGDESLYEHLGELIPWNPGFVSCTYGAGGSTRGRTVEICQQIQSRWPVTATAHFTCVGSSREELLEWLELARRSGIQNIMALRGDPPAGQTDFKMAPGGLRYANELVELIRTHHPEVGIGVAGYPEKHPQAADAQVDLQNLKRKVAAGADAVFTQLFFDNQAFFRFVDQARSAGIDVPIVPGVMPITDFARIKRITSMCGAVVPPALAAKLEQAQASAADQFRIGVDFAIQQCQELMAAGVPGIHFYVLNRSEAAHEILKGLSAPQAAPVR